jgi:hypothetical protein
VNLIEEVGEDGRYPVLRTRHTDEREPICESTRYFVFRRDRFRCVICGREGRLEVDHVIPWSAGGSDDMDNLRTLCHWCNTDRSNFRIPLDVQRRMEFGYECVYCNPDDLLGYPGLRAIQCMGCGRKAPGLPKSATQGQVHFPDDDKICAFCGHKKKSHVDDTCFCGPSCPCQGFEIDRDGLNA